MGMLIYLDANIIFSASNPESNLHRFLNVLAGKHTLVSSPYAMAEAERNVHAKRSQWVATYKAIHNMITVVKDAPLLVDAGLPDKDKPILGAAIAARCDYLLTGDKRDFGHLYDKQIEGVTVIGTLSLAAAILE